MSDGERKRTPVRNGLERAGRFSADRPRVVVALALVVVLVAGGVAAATVTANIGTKVYLSDGSPELQRVETLGDEYDRGKQVYVLVDAPNVTEPETVRTIAELDATYSERDGFRSVRSLADVVRAGANGSIPETQRGVERAIAAVSEQSNASATLVETVHPSEGTAAVVVSYGDVSVPEGAADLYGFMPKRQNEIVTERVRADTQSVETADDVDVTVTGNPVYTAEAFESVFPEIVKLLTTGFVLVVGLVYLVMRGRLRRGWTSILAVLTTVAAMVVMLGAMGLLGYQFSSIMLAILPISLGLGVDYGLQIKTRYVEERENGLSKVDAAGRASRTTGHTLTIAMATTVIGLGSLLISPVPPTRQFGVTASISVIVSMVLSVTLLVALLSWLDVRGTGAATGDGLLESATGRLVGGVARNPIPVLLLTLLVLSGGAAAYPQVQTQDNPQEYWPQNLDARENIERVRADVPSPERMYVLVETESAYSPESLERMDAASSDIEQLDRVHSVVGPASLLADNGRIPPRQDAVASAISQIDQQPLFDLDAPAQHPDSLVTAVYLDEIQGQATVETRSAIRSAVEQSYDDAEVTVTGQAVLRHVIVDKTTSGKDLMTAVSFVLGFLFLGVVFRSLKPPVVIIGGVVVAATLIVAGGMFVFEVPWNPGTVMMSSIVLGIGIDYGLHVYERLQEELEAGTDVVEGLQTALQKLARPILGSGLTTMVGFGVQIISTFPIVSNFGATLIISVFAILASTFFVLPAVLVLSAGLRSDVTVPHTPS